MSIIIADAPPDGYERYETNIQTTTIGELTKLYFCDATRTVAVSVVISHLARTLFVDLPPRCFNLAGALIQFSAQQNLDLKITGEVEISFSETVSHFPRSMVVDGDMMIRSPDTTKLPSELTVTGDLDISMSGIAKLTGKLQVGRWLRIRLDAFKSRVDAHVEVSKVEFLDVHDKDVAQHYYDPQWSPSGSIIRVGDDWFPYADSNVINGDFDLGSYPITKLQDGLKIEGSLYGQGTSIDRFPPRFSVSKDVVLEDATIVHFPTCFTVVHGNLNCRETRFRTCHVERVDGNLDLRGSMISSLPALQFVSGAILVDYRSKLKDVNRKAVVTKGIVFEGKTFSVRHFNNRRWRPALIVGGIAALIITILSW